MSGHVGAGCRIMRCPYLQDSACTYAGFRCRYRIEEDDAELRLKLALDALGEVSEACQYDEIRDEFHGAEDMRNIADSALRRLSLNNPD